ncbi:MAG: hypothetical protein ACJ0KA_06665 [Verrucomicrobiales bacterium]
MLFTYGIHSTYAQNWANDFGYDELVEELSSEPIIDYGSMVIIPAQDTSWKYRKGTSEASSPSWQWRTLDFQENEEWIQGQTPIGYGGGENTVLTDMRGPSINLSTPYTSIYLRRKFIVESGKIPSRLLLRTYIDDGSIIWINGHEVARLNVSKDTISHDSTAYSHEAKWESKIIGRSSLLLNEGENIIAVHAFNSNVLSSDFSFDIELKSTPFKVSLVEAADAEGRFLPEDSPNLEPEDGYNFQGNSFFEKQIFRVKTFSESVSYERSSHSEGVGKRFFGDESITSWIPSVDVYAANQWSSQDFLLFGTLLPPLTEESMIQNHSWITYGYSENSSAAEIDSIVLAHNEIIRRFDYAINRDQFIACVGLNNGDSSKVPSILASSYNAIVVGNTNGSHSRGGTPSVLGIGSGTVNHDGAGRLKPDVVANDNSTSSCTPQVSSAISLLYGISSNLGMPNACFPETMKAIIMAGAEKDQLNDWTRSSTKPIDQVYGAGKINVNNSYKILTKGDQSSLEKFQYYGWDFKSLESDDEVFYDLVFDQDISEVIFSLNWNRSIISSPWINGSKYNASTANMSLSFCRDDGENLILYDFSDSSIDNLEHLYLRGIPKGRYQLKVATDISTEFGLAWRAEKGNLPNLKIGTDSQNIVINCQNLIKGKVFKLQKSNDLLNWSTHKNFTVKETSFVFNEPQEENLENKIFYRLEWDPVN